MKDLTVKEAITILQNMPQDAILLFFDINNDTRSITKIEHDPDGTNEFVELSWK